MNTFTLGTHIQILLRDLIQNGELTELLFAHLGYWTFIPKRRFHPMIFLYGEAKKWFLQHL